MRNDYLYKRSIKTTKRGNTYWERIDIATLFEHDPSGMFTNSIPQTLQNRILAKGIPALSEPLGIMFLTSLPYSIGRNFDMENRNIIKRPNDWCRNHSLYGTRWLHSDIQNVAYYYTFRLFEKFVEVGGLK